ncbi:MAG: T9SS type A sorting domain-containing protein, partial [Hymenobacter sp.]
ANTDDANSAAQNIGFSFGFNGSIFTQFVLNTNGVMRLGSAAPSTATLFLDSNVPAVGTDPLQSTNAADANLLMPFNFDLTAGNGTGGAEYRVATTGTAGTRVCTVQWKNVADKAGVGTANAQQYANLSFQAKLYEATGTIEFVYGPATASANAVATRLGGVGLKGSGLGTGQLLLVAKASTAAWSAAFFRSASYGANTHDVDKTALPDAGRTYRFTTANYCVAATVTAYPYNENFDGVTAPALPCGVAVLDANGDGSTWVNTTGTANTTPNAMRYAYNSTNTANDWFFTNALTMTAGMSYQLQFKYRNNSTAYSEALEVKVGSAATPAAQTTTVYTNTNITGNAPFATTVAGSAAGQVTLFTPTTTGVYYFGFHAFSPANAFYLYVDDVNVTQTVAPACPQPTAITVGSITTTTAAVSFTGPVAGTAYTVVYGPRGFTPSSTSLSQAGPASPITLTGLSPNTPYDVYVVATCGTSGGSVQTGPIGFVTGCATTTAFPYTENFDGVTAPALPCGITTLDANADGVTWGNASGTANTTPNAMRYISSTTVTANDWFFTNSMNLTLGKSYQLQFKYRGSSTASLQQLEVKVGTGATAAGQTTTVFSNTAINNNTFATTVAGGATGQVILFTPTASGVYYFGFHAIGGTSQGILYVDDVQVAESTAPTCPQPTNLVVSGVTTIGATVTFTGPSNGATYTVIYGPRGFTPSSTSLMATGPASPITLAGLTSNTAYDVYVVANCSGTSGSSVRTGPIGFTTACATVTTFPYNENFDSVTTPALPCGITVLDANNDNNTWANLADTPSSSPNAMQYKYSFTNAADDWFFTNAISMQAGATYQLQFKYRAYLASYPEGLEVKVGTAATIAGQTRTVFSNTNITNVTYATTTPGTTTANGQVVGFTPTTSGVYYFGFHAISTVNQYYLYVDDLNVTVTSLASCPTPTAIAVNSVTDSRATVTFSGPSVATSYKVYYVPAGTALNTTTSPFVMTTTTTAQLTGLLPDSPYDVYVQGTCGAAGVGIAGGPVSFRTSCATTTVFPYAQNFDGVIAPALPCGITVLDVNSDGSSWATNNFTPSSAPNAMRYDPSTTNGADDWFFTNALSLQAGMSYQLQFKTRVFSPNYPERLEVKVGLGTTAATQTTTLYYNAALTAGNYVTTAAGTATGQVAPFVPTTSGIYFIGFHAFSRANQFNIFVDDVQVTASVVTATKSNVAPGFRAEASPVPFGESLTLTLNTLKAGPLQLTLLDAVGRVVRETTATVPAGASSLAVPEVRTLPAGMYLLTVRQGGNTQIIRVAHE